MIAVPSFEFATSGRVIVGAGRAAELPALLAGLGTRVLVCTGADPARHDALIAGLGMPAAVFPVSSEPTVELARDAVRTARSSGVDVVLSVGGGSVLDLGKAVAMLVSNDGDPLDYLETVGRGRRITRPAVPCVAVPTTAGTGSEVTANAVLTSVEHGVKASLRSSFMIPRVALVDPELTVGCPPAVTAASGLDALTQCLEPYVSIRANPVTDGLAREGVHRAARGLRRAYADGSDLSARTDMAVCSLLGGMALANAKLGAVHGFAAALGGTLDVPHGVACAALLGPVTAANVRALRQRQPDNPVLLRYQEAARLLTGDPDASIVDGLDWIRDTVRLLGVTGLSAYGLRRTDSAAATGIVAKAAKSSSMQGNPITLTEDELLAVLAEAA